MPSFRDNKDREWTLAIDAPAALAIRNDCDPKFLLNDGAEENTYTRLESDPVLLCRVVYLLCDKQRKEREVSEEDFYLHVIGNAIDRATEAMLEAIINFIPAKARDLLQAVAKVREMQSKAVAMTLEKINNPEAQEKFIAEIAKRLDLEPLMPSQSATSSPALSVSIPAD